MGIGIVVLGVALAPGPAAAETVWVHARVDTRGEAGAQVSRFWAFTTSDEGGTRRVAVARLCVLGTAHRTQERCAENASEIELEERATGLPGLGNRCVETLATATWGQRPLTATARACP
jgi:hypothetical protein